MFRLLSLLRSGWRIRLRYIKTARVGSNIITCSCNSIASAQFDEAKVFSAPSSSFISNVSN